MHRPTRLSASTGHMRPLLRVSPAVVPAVVRPASEPSDIRTSDSPTQSTSDLGSDSEWKFHAGLISDDDPEPDSPLHPSNHAFPLNNDFLSSSSLHPSVPADAYNTANPLGLGTGQPVTSHDANSLQPVSVFQNDSNSVVRDDGSPSEKKRNDVGVESVLPGVSNPLQNSCPSSQPDLLPSVSVPQVCHSQTDFLDTQTFAHSPQPASAFTLPQSQPPSTVTPHPAYYPPPSVHKNSSYSDDIDNLLDHPPDSDEDASSHNDGYDADESFDQQIVIPGYRGVSTRIAPDSQPPSRPHAWADRPRGTTSVMPTIPPAPDSSSGKSSPALGRLHRVGSDSAVSSQGGSIGSEIAFRLSHRTSSETSDASRRTNGPKSLTFIAPNGDISHSNHSSNFELPPVSASPITGDVPSLPHLQANVQTQLQPRGTTRVMFFEGKTQCSNTNTMSGMHLDRRVGFGAESTLQVPDGLSEMTNSPESANPEVLMPPGVSNAALVSEQHMAFGRDVGPIGFERISSKSDAGVYRRQASGLSASSSRSGRHLPVSLDESITGHGAVISRSGVAEQGTLGSAPGTSSASTIGLGISSAGSDLCRNFTMMSAGSRNLSFLECVAEILKGTSVLKRKNFMQATEGKIWLAPNLRRVVYVISKKNSSMPMSNSIDLAKVRRLKGADKDIIVEVEGCKKPIDFIFSTRERADMWLSGLCCLIPTDAIVKSRNHRLESRQLYDPLLDHWNGKPVSTRKRVGEYILLGSIGRGSFGKVKLALSRKEMQFYAVKMLSIEMMRKRMRSHFDATSQIGSGSKFNALDIAEISVMETLDHPNIMKLKHVYDDDDKEMLYIVVEYLPNGPIMSSAKLVGASIISEDSARAAVVDVLCGLEYLHRNNVAHRDIKPDNLLQAGDGTVKISDFGAAVKYGDVIDDDDNTSDLQAQGRTVGTPAFTAPELCLSEKSPPCPQRVFAADIWSLGASLFYMLYGRAPFIAGSVFEMYDAICSRPLMFPTLPSDVKPVSKQAQDVIRMMLTKSPVTRAKISDIIRSDWLCHCPNVAEKLSTIRDSLITHDPTFITPRDGIQRPREVVHRGLPHVSFPLSPRFHR